MTARVALSMLWLVGGCAPLPPVPDVFSARAHGDTGEARAVHNDAPALWEFGYYDPTAFEAFAYPTAHCDPDCPETTFYTYGGN